MEKQEPVANQQASIDTDTTLAALKGTRRLKEAQYIPMPQIPASIDGKESSLSYLTVPLQESHKSKDTSKWIIPKYQYIPNTTSYETMNQDINYLADSTHSSPKLYKFMP